MKIYLPNKRLRELTLRQWRTMGGNGLGGADSVMAAARLECRVKDLESMTLGAITDGWVVCGRNVARFAVENFPKLGDQIVEYEIDERTHKARRVLDGVSA
jgi:hypothetical protein